MIRLLRGIGIIFLGGLILSGVSGGVANVSAAPLGCPANAGLTVTKTVDQNSVMLGTGVTFTITISSNNNCIVTGGSYVDTPDAGLVVASADVPLLSGNFNLDGSDGFTKTVVIHASADQGGTLNNSVSVSGIAVGRTFTGAVLVKGKCISLLPTPTPTAADLQVIEDVACKNVSGEARASVLVNVPQGSPGPQGPPGSPAPPVVTVSAPSVPSLPSTGEHTD